MRLMTSLFGSIVPDSASRSFIDSRSGTSVIANHLRLLGRASGWLPVGPPGSYPSPCAGQTPPTTPIGASPNGSAGTHRSGRAEPWRRIQKPDDRSSLGADRRLLVDFARRLVFDLQDEVPGIGAVVPDLDPGDVFPLQRPRPPLVEQSREFGGMSRVQVDELHEATFVRRPLGRFLDSTVSACGHGASPERHVS